MVTSLTLPSEDEIELVLPFERHPIADGTVEPQCERVLARRQSASLRSARAARGLGLHGKVSALISVHLTHGYFATALRTPHRFASRVRFD